MKKRLLIPIIAGSIAVSLIAGCASHSSGSGSHNKGDMVAEETMAAADTRYLSATAGGFTVDDNAIYYGADVEWEAEAAPQVVGSGGTIVNDVTVDPAEGRLLIRTVSMTCETRDIANAKSDLENKIKELGGYIENSSMSGTGNNKDLRTLNYTIRVPADQMDSLIATVGNNCIVISSSENSSDVTLEYVDTKARIESLRVEYEQLLKLLEQAEDLDTIIILQNRLSEVRYEIESNESRIRVLENQVTYATLHLTVREVLEETEIEEAHVVTYGERVSNQFNDMWENTVDFFQNFLLGIISCIPGIIVMVIIAAVVLIIVFTARNKRRKRRALAAKEAAEKEAKEKARREALEKEEEEKKSEKKDGKKEETKDEGKE